MDRILVANPGFREPAGIRLRGRNSTKGPAGALYWYPNDRENFARRAEVEGELRNEEYVMRRKDGSMLVVVDNCRVVRDANGRVCGFEGTLTDIHRAQEGRNRRFSSQGARAGHPAIDRRCGHYHRFRRAHRLHESGRRKLDRLGKIAKRRGS